MTNRLDGTISILLSNGDGTFAPQSIITSGGTGPYRVEVLDIDRDKNNDIAVININSGNLAIFSGSGSGTFGLPTTYTGLNIPQG